jgi:hypothetical protein
VLLVINDPDLDCYSSSNPIAVSSSNKSKWMASAPAMPSMPGGRMGGMM